MNTHVKSSINLLLIYSKCPKILYTKTSDKMAQANSADPDQTAPEEKPDQSLNCLHSTKYFKKQLNKTQSLDQKSMD